MEAPRSPLNPLFPDARPADPPPSIKATWSTADRLRSLAVDMQYAEWRATFNDVLLCRKGAEALDGRLQIINHLHNEEAVARAISIAILGDDVEWAGYKSIARRFLDAMETSFAPSVSGATS